MAWSSLVLVLSLGQAVPSPPAGSTRWAASYAEAEKEAVRTGRPILAKFYTSWCGWCRKMDRDTFRDPRVVKMSEKDLVFVSLDAEDGATGSQLARKHGVRSFPSVVLIGKDGKAIAGMAGYRPPDRFVSDVAKHLQKAQSGAGAAPPVKLSEDPQELWDQATALERERDGEQAAQRYEALLALRSEKARRFQDLALWNLGELYRRMGDRNRALERYQSLLRSFPATPRAGEAQFQVARLHHFMGNLDDAISGYEQVVERYPTCPCIEGARMELARLQREHGRD